MWKKYLLLFCFSVIPFKLFAQDPQLIEDIRKNPALHSQMQNWVEQVVRLWKGDEIHLQYPQDPLFQKPLGLFVTAKKRGEVRGCMGSLLPREKSLADEVLKNLQKAFSHDPRHRPIQKDELPGMHIYVSALGSPKLLSKPYQIDPARDAILLKSGGKEAVALPGEAKTLRYLLAFLKAKAGLRKTENFQLYRLHSESLEVVLPQSFE